VENSAKGRSRGFPIERQPARCHLIKRHAKGKQVGPLVQRLVDDLFRRHVAHRTQSAVVESEIFVRDRSSVGTAPALDAAARRVYFRQPEVQNPGVAAIDDKDIGRLDVAVNDSFGVGGVKAVGDLDPKR
jgi:hypothetical protein